MFVFRAPLWGVKFSQFSQKGWGDSDISKKKGGFGKIRVVVLK